MSEISHDQLPKMGIDNNSQNVSAVTKKRSVSHSAPHKPKSTSSSTSASTSATTLPTDVKRLCKLCGKKHHFAKGKCPALGKACTICGAKTTLWLGVWTRNHARV